MHSREEKHVTNLQECSKCKVWYPEKQLRQHRKGLLCPICTELFSGYRPYFESIDSARLKYQHPLDLLPHAVPYHPDSKRHLQTLKPCASEVTRGMSSRDFINWHDDRTAYECFRRVRDCYEEQLSA